MNTIAGIDLGFKGCGICIRKANGYVFDCRSFPPAGKSGLSYSEDMGRRHDENMEWLANLLLRHEVRAVVYEEPTFVNIGGNASVKSSMPQWMSYAALRGARLSLGREQFSMHAIQPQAVRRLLQLPKGASKAEVWGRMADIDVELAAAGGIWLSGVVKAFHEHVQDAAAVLMASRFADDLCGLWR